jgi:hypothetical protein
MERFFKKLDELSDLFKQFNASTKLPKLGAGMPKMPKPAIPKMKTGVAPTSQKDPEKVAQQLKNPELKPKTKVAMAKSGQWSLNKEEQDLYHIHMEGQRITDKPMTYKELETKHGPVKRIESVPGQRVIPVKPGKTS